MRCKYQDKISGTKVLLVLRIIDTRFMVQSSPLLFTVDGPRQADDQLKQNTFQRKAGNALVCKILCIEPRSRLHTSIAADSLSDG